jgi:hypothetical protein
MEAIGSDTGTGSTTLYTPLSRTFLKNRTSRHTYNPLKLHRRTHAEHIQQALDIEASKNDASEEAQQRITGVNGLSPLARLASLDFPTSFPHDFMHIMFQSVLPGLFSIWTRSGRYAGLGTGQDAYLLQPGVWSEVGAACARTGDTIPAAFGCRVPDINEKYYEFTAESTMLFATQLAPALLLGRFRSTCYYDHFIHLIRLINMCLGHVVTRKELKVIREGFAQWVQEFERYDIFLSFVRIFSH